jgi:hypothetical protein
MHRLVLLALAVACAAGQTRALFHLSGTILDPSGASVPAADVKLLDSSGHLLQSARTSVSGAYSISNEAPGNAQKDPPLIFGNRPVS